jgi:hypothetical protein
MTSSMAVTSWSSSAPGAVACDSRRFSHTTFVRDRLFPPPCYPYNPLVRRHANFVATVSAGLLVIGFGMIATQQASEASQHPIGDDWFRAGIGCVLAGVLFLAVATLMYVWIPKEERQLNADKRRHDLRTGQKLETGRSLYSGNGRHRLEMASDGNVIEWGDGIVVMWKTDTERTGKANYLTLEADGSLVVRKGDGTKVKTVPGTKGCGGTKLLLQDDGQLVMLGDDEDIAWRTGRAIGVTWGAIEQ